MTNLPSLHRQAMARGVTRWVALTASAWLAGACAEATCAAGATLKDGACVPADDNPCGPGTLLERGACLPRVGAADGSADGTADGSADGGADVEGGATEAIDGGDPVPDIAEPADAALPDGATGDAAGEVPDASEPVDGDAVIVPDAGPCVPACSAKMCGADGCGGSCGTCEFVAGKPYCSKIGECVAEACTPECGGNACGPNGCGGTCGKCATGQGCSNGVCGSLLPEASCKSNCGKLAPSGCSCLPGCSGSACCPDLAAACGCQPLCGAMKCGGDGCGGSCGVCTKGSVCKAGVCLDDPCDPDPCSGHGECAAGTCACAAGFGGNKCAACAQNFVGYPLCSQDPCLDQTCSGKGKCNAKTGACVCDAGFDNADCGKCKFWAHVWPDCKATPCDGNTCNGKGDCTPYAGACACSPGFIGSKCAACAVETETFPACTVPPGGLGVDAGIAGLACPFCGKPLAQVADKFDATDKDAPAVLSVLPPSGAVVGSGASFTLIINDWVDSKSITPAGLKLVPVGGSTVSFAVSVVMQKMPNGLTVVMVFPIDLPYSGPVQLSLTGVKDEGGNLLPKWSTTAHIVHAFQGVGFGANMGFEFGSAGCFLAGDVAAVPGSDNMQPSQGDLQLVLTTHYDPVVSKSGAVEGTTSWAVCGPFPIPPAKTKLLFGYDFASSEFDDIVGKQYGDIAMVMLSAAKGGTGGVLTSVSAATMGGAQTKAYGLPDPGDSDNLARHLGAKTAVIQGVDKLGGWMTLTFIVTDAINVKLDSVLTIDNVRFE